MQIDCEKMGKAALESLLVGAQFLIDEMQRHVNELRKELANDVQPKKLGRPRTAKKDDSGPSPQKSYWAKMTPEERSEEMARRMKKARINHRRAA